MGIEKRGFGSMSVERKKEIAAMGGRACQKAGTGHRLTAETAPAAGRRGQVVLREKRARRALELAEDQERNGVHLRPAPLNGVSVVSDPSN